MGTTASAAGQERAKRMTTAEPPATVHEYLRVAGRTGIAHAESIAGLAAAVAAGADRRFALRELLDDVARITAIDGPAATQRIWVDEPQSTGDAGVDAFLAGLAEHLAERAGLESPAWVEDPRRFLSTFWFPHKRTDFDAIALRDSPGPFRRRNVYVHPSSLERV